MFSPGDKIVCIDITDIIDEDLMFLKIESIYSVVDYDYDSKNDMGYVGVKTTVDISEVWYMEHRFIKLSEYRKQKIKRLKDV